ncbi:hypothetical protein HD554DRAFT_2202286 [Boletus coccyginus]|nr:hypothetical protein HD554DRAFT_2202286 [Boletus coccyginus]
MLLLTPPYNYVDEPPAGVPKSNMARTLRNWVPTSGGFQFVHHLSAEKDFVDEDKIKSVYYAEVEHILKKQVGVKRVFIFDHTIRRSPADQNVPSKALHSHTSTLLPWQHVHVDQTSVSAAQRVEYHLGNEAERLLQGRYRIINVWRCAGGAHLTKHPLMPRLIYADREGATSSVKYNPVHKWYYLSGRTPDEVIIIKCFDSGVDKAHLTPYSAFHDPPMPLRGNPSRYVFGVLLCIFSPEF